MQPSNKSRESVAFAFVGSVAPDDPQFHNPAFNRAGQMYQHELLVGLKRAGLPASAIISAMPVPSRRHHMTQRLWIRSQSANLADGLSIEFLPFINITPLKQISVGLGTVLELLRWGWRNRRAPFRVVYCYNLTVPPGICILLSARLIGAKAIVSLCDIDVPGETVPGRFYWKLDYWLQRRMIPYFDGHVVASDAIAHDFLDGKPWLRLEGGVRKEILEQTVRKVASATESASGASFVVVAAGHLNETNGLPVLLEAFSLLRGEGYRLRIAGGGPLEAQVRAAAAADPRIEFLGVLSFQSVIEMYKSASVLINMRMTKTQHTRYFFPSKMMEYLASGAPVITTCTGHVEKEFGNFVYLLKEETPQGLSQLIRQVAALDPEERRQTGERARAYMAAHKTWTAQTEKLADFIRGAVLHSRPRTSVKRA
jgi:glycosyltransferase involved in cell wall biosynthesis